MRFTKVDLLLAAVLLGMLPDARAQEKEFPQVPMLAGAEPRYMSLMADPFSGRPVYLLFDGSARMGYSRVYVWSPGDKKYEKPVSLSAMDSKFPAIVFTGSNEKDKATVSWVLQAIIRKGGGDYTHFDYLTGETRKVERDQVDVPVFPFEVNFGLGEKGQITGEGRGYPLEILVRGDAPNTGDFAKTGKPFEPWNQLNIVVNLTPFPEEEKSGRLRVAGQLRYGHWPASFVSLPSDGSIRLMVSPYREDPVFDSPVPWDDFFSGGIAMLQPYGWYDVRWKLDVRGIKEPHNYIPACFPLSRAAPAGM